MKNKREDMDGTDNNTEIRDSRDEIITLEHVTKTYDNDIPALNDVTPEEQKKQLRKSDKYAEFVKKIANSKEFRAALPDNKLTPLNFKQFTKNPETVKKIAGDFNQNLLKSAKAKKKAPKPPEKKEPEKKKVK